MTSMVVTLLCLFPFSISLRLFLPNSCASSDRPTFDVTSVKQLAVTALSLVLFPPSRLRPLLLPPRPRSFVRSFVHEPFSFFRSPSTAWVCPAAGYCKPFLAPLILLLFYASSRRNFVSTWPRNPSFVSGRAVSHVSLSGHQTTFLEEVYRG